MLRERNEKFHNFGPRADQRRLNEVIERVESSMCDTYGIKPGGNLMHTRESRIIEEDWELLKKLALTGAQRTQ